MERPDVGYVKNKGQYKDVGGRAAVELCEWIEYLEEILDEHRISY